MHLTINGEVIKTTPEHPFYVKEQGFVNACELKIGDELLDTEQNVLIVEDIYFEICKMPVKVYNFEVKDFHTYHVGQNNILVHNFCKPEAAVLGSKKHGVKWKEGSARAKSTNKPQGQWSNTDIDLATQQANTLPPGKSGYFDLPDGSASIVHMPDGTIVNATKFWVKNNGVTWHGYPMP